MLKPEVLCLLLMFCSALTNSFQKTRCLYNLVNKIRIEADSDGDFYAYTFQAVRSLSYLCNAARTSEYGIMSNEHLNHKRGI